MSLVRQIVAILILVTIAGAAWYLTAQTAGSPIAESDRADPTALVEIAEARTGVITQHVEAVGTLRAKQSIAIKANASGQIADIRFEAGEQVEQDEVLVTLDREIEEANAAEARAMLRDAEAQYERARQLLANKTVAQAQVDALNAAFAAARARLAAAERRLRDRQIRAPFAGVVGLREVDLGARINEDTVVTTLDDLSAVELEFSVPGIFYGRIQRGQAVAATTASFPDQTFAGRIASIDTRIDPIARSFRVRAELPNPDNALPAGLFMVVRVTLGSRPNAVIIPEEAVVAEGRSTYVFRVRDGTAERVEVELGHRQVGEVEVLKGLRAGDSVVVAGLQRLRDGAPVRVRQSRTVPTS
ncbi:efflux RND transporter periplasmic adaptor subunit [Rhodospirillaceae bacterium SYSU D60014]|uniref:efflux RND transporter periplasmic adaptor subunit n=1 Tax=Virgifigura deserti TaxID=2268457 RepID=UPI000E67221D